MEKIVFIAPDEVKHAIAGNRATLGGNLGSASPAADACTALDG